MKSEKGEILEVCIIFFTIFIIAGVFLGIGYLIKNEVDYGKKEGIIIDKKYNSSYTTMVTSGKTLVPQYHPETWNLKIQKEVNGQVKSIWVSVDEYTYHNFGIGDYYPEGED